MKADVHPKVSSGAPAVSSKRPPKTRRAATRPVLALVPAPATRQWIKSEQDLRRIFENLQDAYVETSLDGIVLDVSPQIETLTQGQYSRANFLGASARDFYADASQRDALVAALKDKGRVRDFEIVFRNRNGSLIPASVSATLDCDASGQPLRISAMLRDITERKRTEDELREMQRRYRTLVEQSLAGIYIIQNGNVAYVNPHFASLFGYPSAQEMIGLDILSLVDAADRSAVDAKFNHWLKGQEESLSTSFVAWRRDGTTFDVGIHVAHAIHEGKPALVGMVQDISEKRRQQESTARHLAQLEMALTGTVNLATKIIDMRDPYTAGHQSRVARIALAIGAALNLPPDRLKGLGIAAQLHDIGKITAPAEILAKPGRLSAAEFALIKGHAQAGYDLLEPVEFPWPLAQVAHQHHERMDGSGYPQGLKGEEILLEARIVAVADVVESMMSHRPYRPALGIDKALAEIERGRGSAYDPAAVDACVRLFREQSFVIAP